MMQYKKFNWDEFVEVPPNVGENVGNQILHFYRRNKPFTQNPEAVLFVKEHLTNALAVESDAESLKEASERVTIDGAYLEMGVCTGNTINFIAALNPKKVIYGFDSFQGLPEDWDRGEVVVGKGTFKFKEKRLPPVLLNVELHPGWFKDTLPKFKKEILKETPVAFLHIDCDLYSSTKEVFEILKENICDGTVILFDEFYNYQGSEVNERKAFDEFLKETSFSVEYLVYNRNSEQVAVRIVT